MLRVVGLRVKPLPRVGLLSAWSLVQEVSSQLPTPAILSAAYCLPGLLTPSGTPTPWNHKPKQTIPSTSCLGLGG